MRRVYIVAGTISVVLGIIGAFLPIMPTTVFLLIAAACYARGSASFYVWLMTNRWFGAHVRHWRERRGLPARVKAYVLLTVALPIGVSIAVVPLWPVRLGLLAVGLGVAVYIARLPAPAPAGDPAER
jgi:hypothetical protein